MQVPAEAFGAAEEGVVSAMMVLLPKQVHLQKEVAAAGLVLDGHVSRECEGAYWRRGRRGGGRRG